jgi:hypothetical protein
MQALSMPKFLDGTKTREFFSFYLLLTYILRRYSWANDTNGEFVSAVTGFTVFDGSSGSEVALDNLDPPLVSAFERILSVYNIDVQEIRLPLDVNLPKPEIVVHSVVCSRTPEFIDVICPNDFTYQHHCNGSFAYQMNYTCPYQDVVGLCSFWNATTSSFEGKFLCD